LRGAAGERVGGNRGTEHLHVPVGRRFRIFADDVDVIELEGRIAHCFAFHPDWHWDPGLFRVAIVDARSLG